MLLLILILLIIGAIIGISIWYFTQNKDLLTNKKSFIQIMNSYPFHTYKSKSGIVGNHYGHTVIKKNGFLKMIDGNAKYKLFHTVEQYDKGAYDLLNSKSSYMYYIRFIGMNNPFLRDIITPNVKTETGWSVTSCLISNKGSVTNLHIDGKDGKQRTLYGSKRWLIFEPKYRKALGFIGNNQRSSIFEGKLTKDILPKGVEYKEVITKQGDTILIKRGYPHYVETLEDFSVNIGWRKK